MKPKILLVDDRAEVVRHLKRNLEQNGYEVYIAFRGREALEVADQHRIDVALLDLMLPDARDLSVCEELRRRHSDLPIIILSIEKDVHMRVQALHSCADDYIIKPFDMEEVLARIKVQLDHAHRMRPGSEQRSFTAGPLTMNFDQRRVTINGQEVDLTHTEYELLYVLVLNRDRIVTYDYLRSQVWDDEDTENNNIHAYINRLRKKIEAPCDHRFIYNEPKVGYRFETRGFTLFRNE
jgi:DNA-binding response OmpR family regulator